MNIRLIKVSLSWIALLAVFRFAARPSMLSRNAYDAIIIPKNSVPIKKVAICIMLTQADAHPRGGQMQQSLDGAATLRRSIMQVYNLTEAKMVQRLVGLNPYNLNNNRSVHWMQPQVEKVSVYEVEMGDSKTVEMRFVALVDDDVDEKWIKVLRVHGYEVWKTRTPMDHTEVRSEKFAKQIKDSGAIGTAELIKLEGLRMKSFDTVFLFDCDVLFHRRFDELMGIEESFGWTVGGYVQEKINGGFLMYNPNHPASRHHLDQIVEILKEGDFRPGSGWRGSSIGWGWGGPTIQGILPYYYFMEATKEQDLLEKRLNITLAPSHRELDRCRYNNMAQLDRCANLTPFESVTSNHFTSTCSKPWHCVGEIQPLCDRFRVEFTKQYKEMVLELAQDRTYMNGSEVVQFVKDVKDGEWCVDEKFVSVSALLAEHI